MPPPHHVGGADQKSPPPTHGREHNKEVTCRQSHWRVLLAYHSNIAPPIFLLHHSSFTSSALSAGLKGLPYVYHDLQAHRVPICCHKDRPGGVCGSP